MTKIAIAGVFLAVLATAFAAVATEIRKGDITIIDPWSRATPGMPDTWTITIISTCPVAPTTSSCEVVRTFPRRKLKTSFIPMLLSMMRRPLRFRQRNGAKRLDWH